MAKAARTFRIGSIVGLLSPALGREQSQELVTKAASRLDITADELELEQALRVIDALGEEKGIVGVSARFARARLVHRDATQRSGMSSRPPVRPSTAMDLRAVVAEAPPASLAPAPSKTWSVHDVVRLLAASLGKERAEEVVGAAISRLSFVPPLQQAQVTAVLEYLSRQSDVVGVVARFAGSRLALLRGG